MSRSWTQEQRLKQSAKMVKVWQGRIEAKPDAHPVARARVLRDLSQAELAELGDVSVATIAAIEAGKSCSRSTARRLEASLATPGLFA
jgi:DNA-binding XRE family transcriptional regulator